MFKTNNVQIVRDPVCHLPVHDVDTLDFSYYDKDGFELNAAERAYYRLHSYPINHNCLNHTCWQEPWFEIEEEGTNLILDHSLILHRCAYIGQALDQLIACVSKDPRAWLLANTKAKWGFDFALDAVFATGEVFEVLHVEIDHRDYDAFVNHMLSFEYTVKHSDWIAIAKSIWSHRDKWQHLKGYAQNNWKSKFIIGDAFAEHTLKSI